jgi:hypothetical protein
MMMEPATQFFGFLLQADPAASARHSGKISHGMILTSRMMPAEEEPNRPDILWRNGSEIGRWKGPVRE